MAVKWSLLSGPVAVLATSTKALIRLGPNLCGSQEISCHLIHWILSKSAFVICIWALESYIFIQPPGWVHNGTEYAQIAKVQATANCKFASNLLANFLNNIISGFSYYLDFLQIKHNIEFVKKRIKHFRMLLQICCLVFRLIWFLTSYQQSFSYKGTGLPGLKPVLS